MALTFDQLMALSDARSGERGVSLAERNAPGTWTSVKRGFGSGVGAIGSMLRDVAPDVGGAVEEWGQEMALRNPRQ